MITPRGRAGLVLALLALLALLTGCGAGTAASSAGAATPGSAPGSSSSAPSPRAASAQPARALTLTVAGGKVTGDTGTVKVKVGEAVELTVHSDVADEVHVHGVDIGRDVAAGGTVVIDFTQTAPGRFEVELEGRKQVLTRLQVS